MVRNVIRVFGWLAVLAIAAVVAVLCVLLFAGGGTIKAAVNQFGPQLLGVPVTLQGAELSPFAGKARLQGLHIGNPEGFRTPSLFDVADVDVELDTLSLFSGTVHIRKILIAGPKITFEKGRGPSNVRVVRDTLAGAKKDKPGTTPTNGPPKKKTGAKKEERKVIIDELVIRDSQLNASLTALNGNYIAVKLGEISVRDIGKEEQGVPFSEAIKTLVAAITASIEEAVGGVADSVKDTAREIKKNAAPLIDSLKDLFGGRKEKKSKPAEPKEEPPPEPPPAPPPP